MNDVLAAGAIPIIAGFLVMMVVQASFRRGRLARVPIPDDVGTFWVAAAWVRAFYEKGLPGIADLYIRVPPHSPYSVLTSFLGFLLFGVKEWAPYVMSVVQVSALLALVHWLTRGLGLTTRLAVMLFAASMPFVSAGIHENKGDFPGALAMGAAAVVLLSGPFWSASRARHFGVGLLLALSLWMKPSLFAPTILLAVGMLGVSYVAEWVNDRRMPSIRRAIATLARMGLVTVLLTGPHFWLAGRHLWAYMMRNTLGGKDQEKWVIPGDFWFQAKFYLTGTGGQKMIGPFLFICAGLIGVALVVMLARKQRDNAVRLVALCSVLGAAYLMPTLNPVKSGLLGLVFHSMLGMAGVASLGYLLSELDLRGRRAIAPALAGGLALTGAWLYRPTFVHHPFSQTASWRLPLEEQRELIEKIFGEVVRHAKNGPVNVALVSGSGDLSYSLFTLYAVRDGVDINVSSVHGVTVQDYVPLIDRADIVVAAEPGTGMQLDLFETPEIHQAALELMRNRADFVEVMRLKAPRTDSMYSVFERKEMVLDGFEDVRALSGMLPTTGPFPQWHTPRVRWGVAPGSEIEPLVPAGSYVLGFACQSHEEDQVLTIRLDGQEIGILRFAATRVWETLEIPVELGPGEHRIRLEYAKGAKTPDAARAVLFRGISLRPKRGVH